MTKKEERIQKALGIPKKFYVVTQNLVYTTSIPVHIIVSAVSEECAKQEARKIPKGEKLRRLQYQVNQYWEEGDHNIAEEVDALEAKDIRATMKGIRVIEADDDDLMYFGGNDGIGPMPS